MGLNKLDHLAQRHDGDIVNMAAYTVGLTIVRVADESRERSSSEVRQRPWPCAA